MTVHSDHDLVVHYAAEVDGRGVAEECPMVASGGGTKLFEPYHPNHVIPLSSM